MAKTWLVTGCSRGLGRALAEAIVRKGDNLVATARNPDELDDLAILGGSRVAVAALDVTDPAAAEKAVATAVARFGRLDVVVNNAGYGNVAPIEDTGLDAFRTQIETNLFGTIIVTKAAIPLLRQQRSGHFIQISSIGGRVGATGRAPYSAAKFGVEGFSEVLASEMAPFGVKVTIVEPGGFRTDFAGASTTISDGNPAYAGTVGRIAAMQREYDGHQPGDPARAAAAIIAIASEGAPPLRLVLGSDAYSRASGADEARLAELLAWRETSVSTDFPDPASDVHPSRWYAFAGERTGILLRGAETDSTYALLQGTKSPGSATPIHRHEIDSEAVYVLSGGLSVQTEEGVVTLTEGEVAVLPPGGVHRLANVDAEDARYLVLCTPANFEAFVEAVSPVLPSPDAPVEAPKPEDIQRMIAAAPAFGIDILPPASLPPVADAVRLCSPADVAETIDVLGLRIEVLGRTDWGGPCDDDIVMLRSTFAPGQVIPLHTHHDIESCFVLEGEIELYNGIGASDAWTRLATGELRAVAPDAPHALRNVANTPARVLAISTGRIVRFFREAQQTLEDCQPTEIGERLAEVAARYGYGLMTPAENAAIGLAAA